VHETVLLTLWRIYGVRLCSGENVADVEAVEDGSRLWKRRAVQRVWARLVVSFTQESL